MEYVYRTNHTCSSQIRLNIEKDVVTNIRFVGGCNGNLKAIASLVDGWKADDIAEKCQGITCDRRATSCADQLARAVKAAQAAEQKES